MLKPILVPALNKWTKVAPCMRHVSVLQNFCRLVPRAFEACFKTSARNPREDDSEDEGAEVGAPIDQARVWQRLARKRLSKAGLFLQDQASRWRTALWVVLTCPVMRIHYSLFKHATWLSERAQQTEPGGEQLTVATFCMAAESPAKKALQGLVALLLDQSQEDWGPVILAFGPVSSWQQPLLRVTRRSLCVVIGQLFRKLLYPWTQYPWRLAQLIDPAASPEAKKECAKELFEWPRCCLDGFAQKLRETAKEPKALEQERVLRFLTAVFERLVPTSTCIERQFARLSEWSGGGGSQHKGPKAKLSSIAAKHCNHTLEHEVKIWRTNVLKQKKRRIHNQRPSWVRPVSARQNGWNLFEQDLLGRQPALRQLNHVDRAEAAREAWSACSQEEKNRWASLAKTANSQARAEQEQQAEEEPEIAGGPWQLGSSTGWPLARHLIAQRCNTAISESNRFRQKHNVLQPENADSLDSVPAEPWPLFAPCPVGACQHCLRARRRPCMERLTELFWKVVLTKGPNAASSDKEPLLLSFTSASREEDVSLAVAFHTRRAPLQAAVFLLGKLLEPAGEGIQVSFHIIPPGEDIEIHTESSVIANLANDAEDWKLELLEPGPVTELNRFDIRARHAIAESEYGIGVPEPEPSVSQDVRDALAAFEAAHPDPKAKILQKAQKARLRRQGKVATKAEKEAQKIELEKKCRA